MILADIPTPSAEFMGNWMFAGFAFVSIIAIIVAILSYFATRREVDDLKISNIKAWEQMEQNRMEAKDASKDSDTAIAKLQATIEALTNSVNLLTLEVHNLRSKK